MRFLVLAWFALIAAITTIEPAHARGSEAELLFWQTVTETDSAEMYQAYLDSFPEGVFRPIAQIKLRELASEAQDELASNLTQCDALAGHASDPSLPVAPTSFADLQDHARDALRVCQTAMEISDDPRYVFQTARSLYALDRVEEAIAHYQRAADAGHLRSMYRIAVLNDEELWGVEKDAELARDLYTELAAQKYSHGLLKLGIFDVLGIAADERDHRAAIPHLEDALRQGLPAANYWLGRVYSDDRGVPVDAPRALAYFKAARAEVPNYRRQRTFEKFVELTFAVTMKDILAISDATERTVAASDATLVIVEDLVDFSDTQEELAEVLAAVNTEIGNIMDKIPGQIDRHGDGVSPMQTDVLAQNMRLLTQRYTDLVLDRYTLFPDAAATRTRDATQSMAQDLIAKVNDFDHVLLRTKSQNDLARRFGSELCLERRNPKWSGREFSVRLRNNCPIDKTVFLRLTITYPGSNTVDEKDFRFDILANRESSTKTIRSSQNGQATADVDWKECPASTGFTANFDPNEKQYRCNNPRGIRSLALDRAQEIRDLSSALLRTHPNP